MMNKPVFRFAPSPNGHLHLGHAYSALLNLKMARESGGKILLRLEDIDTTRCTPQLESQMLRDLEWIGFEWDEEPRRQSEHFDTYQEALKTLQSRELVYPATLSRTEIKKYAASHAHNNDHWPTDPDGAPLYPGTERELDSGKQEEILNSEKPFAMRLDIKKALQSFGKDIAWKETRSGETKTIMANPQAWGDVILARKDTPTSYHLCCVMDDALQGITHVVRGMDLYHTTSIHVLLQEVLELPRPVYHHHDLIVDESAEKLSKSKKHESLLNLRETGISPQEVKKRIGLAN